MTTVSSKFIHNFPPSDDNSYVIKNGAFVKANIVDSDSNISRFATDKEFDEMMNDLYTM